MQVQFLLLCLWYVNICKSAHNHPSLSRYDHQFLYYQWSGMIGNIGDDRESFSMTSSCYFVVLVFTVLIGGLLGWFWRPHWPSTSWRATFNRSAHCKSTHSCSTSYSSTSCASTSCTWPSCRGSSFRGPSCSSTSCRSTHWRWTQWIRNTTQETKSKER